MYYLDTTWFVSPHLKHIDSLDSPFN